MNYEVELAVTVTQEIGIFPSATNGLVADQVRPNKDPNKVLRQCVMRQKWGVERSKLGIDFRFLPKVGKSEGVAASLSEMPAL